LQNTAVDPARNNSVFGISFLQMTTVNLADMRNDLMPLEPDIIERIQRDFSPEDAAIAIELLTASGETGRVARCIVVAAAGKLESLREQIDVAHPLNGVVVTLSTDPASVGARLNAIVSQEMQVSTGPLPVGPRLEAVSVGWFIAVNQRFHRDQRSSRRCPGRWGASSRLRFRI
jgi:hypothetical protein